MLSMCHTDCDIPCSIQWVDSQHSDVCTNSPVLGKTFCHDHCSLLEREASDVPKDFLKFCGTNLEGTVSMGHIYRMIHNG